MTETAPGQLPYHLRLDAPALLATLAGDPNTVEGEAHIPGSSLLGAFAATWITRRQLGRQAHEDATFAHWFLRDGLTFLNAYPQDPGHVGTRLLPAPRSFRRQKGDASRLFDLAAPEPAEATEALSNQFCRLNGEAVAAFTPRMRLRLHTARADRLLGRPTADAGALFAYEALDGGQTFLGRILGDLHELAALASGLGWTPAEPLTLSLGRSRSAEYGGQARLRLLTAGPQPAAGEIDARQEPESGLVLTLTAPLLPAADGSGDGRLAFPFEQLASALRDQGIPVEGETLRRRCRAFTRPVLVGGYSGVWRMPRPQLAGFAAGSVFCFPDVALPAERCLPIEQQPLGQRTGEGFGRFVLNWHGGTAEYRLEPSPDPARPPRPTTPPPETFRRVSVDLARRWAAERTRAAALLRAGRLSGPRPSPALLRRLADLLRGLSLDQAPALRRRLDDLRRPASEQLRRSAADGMPLPALFRLLCSPDLPEQAPALERVLGLEATPHDLRSLLREVDQDPLSEPAQRAGLAALYVQVFCAEVNRRLRTERHPQEGNGA